MPSTLKPSHDLSACWLPTQYAFLTLLLSLTTWATQAASYRVDVSALSQTAGTFEAYVDTRRLSAPFDVASVTLQIRCRLSNGQLSLAWVPFTDKLLSRGSLFVKVFDLPAPCTTWDRLVDARAPLALGKADGPDTQVRVRQGAIQGTPISLSPPLPAPVLSSPTHGSVFSHYPRRTVLSWLPVNGADSYTVEVQMGTEVAWFPRRYVPNLRVNQYVFDFVGAQPGRWRVWAVRSNGAPGHVSPWWEFRYTK